MTDSYRDPALPDIYHLKDADDFQFALTEAQQDILYGYLFPDDDETPNPAGNDLQENQYERGVIGLITRSTGRTRSTYLLHDFIPPKSKNDVYTEEQDLGERLFFGSSYKLRSMMAAEEMRGGGLIYFHSHPGWSAYPSSADREADRDRLHDVATNVSRNPEQIPLAAGIVAEYPRHNSQRRDWSIRGYDFSGDYSSPVNPVPASVVRVVGPSLRKLPTSHNTGGTATSSPNLSHQDSALEIWGEKGQAVLAGLTVAVVGCGGVGSLLAEQIARLGVGEAIFVDFDRIEPANLNRAYGATHQDARNNEFKTRVACRVANRSATARGFKARSVVGSVVENELRDFTAMGDILDADIILNAADHHWARMILDNISRAHLIPAIDGGTDLQVSEERKGLDLAASSEVHVTAPGHPCLECQGAWMWGSSEEGVNREQRQIEDRGAEEELYVNSPDSSSEGPRAPSVITTNGLVASLMMERFTVLTLGTTDETLVGSQRYNPAYGTVVWRKNPDGSRTVSCDEDCFRAERAAAGDGSELGSGIDHDLRNEIQKTKDK